LQRGSSFQVNDSFGIPILGFATTFFGPSWKGRVQFTASPFASASGSTFFREIPAPPAPAPPLRDYRSSLSGAAYSLEVEGGINMSPEILIGVFGAYNRLDLEGSASGGTSTNFRSAAEADIGVVGLSLMYLF
jgi:hypothetical protein